jgi:hypothetical protein
VTPSGSDNFAFDANDRLFATLLGRRNHRRGDGGWLNSHVRAGGHGQPLAASPSGSALTGESIFVADLWMLQEFDSATGEFLGKVDNLMPNTVVVDGDNLLITSWFGNAVFVWNPDAKELVEEYYDFNMPMNTSASRVTWSSPNWARAAWYGSAPLIRRSAPRWQQALSNPWGLATDDENLWLSDRDTGKGVASHRRWRADGRAASDRPRTLSTGRHGDRA